MLEAGGWRLGHDISSCIFPFFPFCVSPPVRFGQMAESWQEEFDDEKANLKKFILKRKPHVIVLAADAASGRDTKQVQTLGQ